MKVKVHEWMWTVAGFSLMLLVGCSADSKKSGMKNESPKVTMNVPKQETIISETGQEIKVGASRGTFADSDHLKPVYFDLHHSKLSDEGMSIVKENADWIKSQPPFLLQVVGVADRRGSISRNKTLAERRASHVKEAYVAQGIAPERIQIVALGEESERCLELTEDCFKLSRRAETKIEEKALLAQR